MTTKPLFLLAVLAALTASAASAQEMLADANKDGKITPAEYQASRRNFLMRSDYDHDGKITKAEWDRGALNTRMELDDRGAKNTALIGKGGWFQAIDVNKDGAATPAEIDAYTAKRFAQHDPNGDGVITRPEAAQIERAAAKTVR